MILAIYQLKMQFFRKSLSKNRSLVTLYTFLIYFYGRIAQLVELLSYTQVVIGSSPVAPILSDAGVVQLVRALPCHGRSCGFEPRLPRILKKAAKI